MGSEGRVLFVCTGNQCRSPMAEALLRRRLAGRPIEVGSAGLVGDGTPPPPETVEAMREIGLDVEGRPSVGLTPELVEAAGLVVTMTRDQLLETVSMDMAAWDRCFVLGDLAGRAAAATPLLAGEAMGSWVARVGAGRRREDLLRTPAQADLPDPMGRDLRAHRRTRDRLVELTDALALGLGVEAAGPEGHRSWLGGKRRGR